VIDDHIPNELPPHRKMFRYFPSIPTTTQQNKKTLHSAGIFVHEGVSFRRTLYKSICSQEEYKKSHDPRAFPFSMHAQKRENYILKRKGKIVCGRNSQIIRQIQAPCCWGIMPHQNQELN